jgi:hypothetical protein
MPMKVTKRTDGVIDVSEVSDETTASTSTSEASSSRPHKTSPSEGPQPLPPPRPRRTKNREASREEPTREEASRQAWSFFGAVRDFFGGFLSGPDRRPLPTDPRELDQVLEQYRLMVKAIPGMYSYVYEYWGASALAKEERLMLETAWACLFYELGTNVSGLMMVAMGTISTAVSRWPEMRERQRKKQQTRDAAWLQRVPGAPTPPPPPRSDASGGKVP